jgi:hypothetical protein
MPAVWLSSRRSVTSCASKADSGSRHPAVSRSIGASSSTRPARASRTTVYAATGFETEAICITVSGVIGIRVRASATP